MKDVLTEGLLGAGGGALGAGLGMIAARGQHRRQKELMDIQYRNQQGLNQQGYDLNKKMWDETNYGAQKKHMKDAGLNPALMYGSAGAGGQATSGSGGSAGSGSAPMMDISQGMQGAMQGAMMKAQIENIKADTKEKLTNAGFREGVETAEARQRIASLGQGIENQKAQKELTQVQTKLAQFDQDVKDRTKEWEIAKSFKELEYLQQEVKQIGWRNDLEREQVQAQTKLLNEQILKSIADRSLIDVQKDLGKSQKNLTDEQKWAIQHEIITKYISSISQGVGAVTDIMSLIKQIKGTVKEMITSEKTTNKGNKTTTTTEITK